MTKPNGNGLVIFPDQLLGPSSWALSTPNLRGTQVKTSAKYIKMSFCSRINSCFSFRCSLDRAASSVLPAMVTKFVSQGVCWPHMGVSINGVTP